MGLPRGIPKKTKTSLKGDLAHPVPPPSLPGQGRERRQRKRVERRGDPRGEARIGSERDTKCKCMGSAAAAGPGPRAEEEVREKRGGDPRGEARMEGKRDTKCKRMGSASGAGPGPRAEEELREKTEGRSTRGGANGRQEGHEMQSAGGWPRPRCPSSFPPLWAAPRNSAGSLKNPGHVCSRAWPRQLHRLAAPAACASGGAVSLASARRRP